MLVYEKLCKEPLKILSVLEGDSTTPSRIDLRGFAEVHRTVPPDIYQTVLRDNQEFLLEKNLYSADFFEFFLEVMRRGKEFRDVSGVCVEYALDLVAHAFHNKTLQELVNVVKECFARYPGSERQFLGMLVQDNMEILSNFLLVCTDKGARSSFARLLAAALLCSVGEELVEGSQARVIIDGLLSMVPGEVAKHATRFDNFWQVFALLSESEVVCLYLLQRGVVALFIDFYLSGNSPLLQKHEQRAAIGNNLWTPGFSGLVTTIRNLDVHVRSNRGAAGFGISQDDLKCMNEKEFYDKSMRNGYDCKALARIICHWSTGDRDFSGMIAEVLLQGINTVDFEETKDFYEVLQCFLGIEDEFSGIF